MKTRIKWVEGVSFVARDRQRPLGRRRRRARKPAAATSARGRWNCVLAGAAACTRVRRRLDPEEGAPAGGRLRRRGRGRAGAGRAQGVHGSSLRLRVAGRGLDPRQVERAVKLSKEKYCSATIMLGKTAEITYADRDRRRRPRARCRHAPASAAGASSASLAAAAPDSVPSGRRAAIPRTTTSVVTDGASRSHRRTSASSGTGSPLRSRSLLDVEQAQVICRDTRGASSVRRQPAAPSRPCARPDRRPAARRARVAHLSRPATARRDEHRAARVDSMST